MLHVFCPVYIFKSAAWDTKNVLFLMIFSNSDKNKFSFNFNLLQVCILQLYQPLFIVQLNSYWAP